MTRLSSQNPTQAGSTSTDSMASAIPTGLFGNALAPRCDLNTGDSLSLTAEQKTHLTAAIAIKPPPELIDRLAESLAPLPEIVELLRSL